MAFESLTEKLQNVFKNLRSKGKLTEKDVKEALKEVKMALLEADVNFKVVRSFVKSVQEKAVGEDVMNGLNPAQMVIKIVSEEMTQLMGSQSEELQLNSAGTLTVIMMMGLQGAGKTTTAVKLAAKYKSQGRRPLLAACDIYRPAAALQLQVNGQKMGIDVLMPEDGEKPEQIAARAVAQAEKNNYDLVILDTAGRLHVDDEMMRELERIRETVRVDRTLLVVDAMTGQDAVNTAETFEDRIGIDGVILTKMDGDSRGGAALSVRATCGKPIYFVGMGEKLSDLEVFYPDRMTSRILGMGDVMSLIEKAQENLDEDKAREMEKKLKKASFGFDDYLESMTQMKKMGGLSSVIGMLPGIGSGQMKMLEDSVDEKAMGRTEAIILSMTPQERTNPDILTPSRKARIARGAGVDISEVNRLVKQFEGAKKMMKQMAPAMSGKRSKFPGLNLFGPRM